MLYKRSSFINWLRSSKDCEITPLPNNPKVLKIENGVMSTYISTNRRDTIPYEEIFMHCDKLMIVGLPGDKDLIRVE